MQNCRAVSRETKLEKQIELDIEKRIRVEEELLGRLHRELEEERHRLESMTANLERLKLRSHRMNEQLEDQQLLVDQEVKTLYYSHHLKSYHQTMQHEERVRADTMTIDVAFND